MLLAALQAMRPYQWTKNLLVLAALVFSHEAMHVNQVVTSLCAFGLFCFASSAIYVINDIMDLERDRNHPKKQNRPIARGALSVPAAWVLAVVLLAVALAGAWYVRVPFFGALLVYVVLTALYSFGLKHVAIVDVLVVALGFVLRAMAGALALNVTFTNWLVVCTLFLALFLALSKRRQELLSLEGGAGGHRAVLDHYSVAFLDQAILIVAGGTLITYTIYTCSPEVVDRMGTDKLYATLPFVVYGLFRYLSLMHQGRESGDPSSTLLRDWPLALTVVLWGITCGLIIYGGGILG